MNGASPETSQARVLQVIVGFALLPILFTACPTHKDRRPANVLRKYIQAIHKNSPQAGYRLLGETARHHMTLGDFTQRWKETEPERTQQAAAIDEALKRQPKITAEITPKNGKPLRMTYIGGHWVIASGIDLGGGGMTPRETIVSLLTAVERRDYLAVRRLMAPAVAKAIEHEIEKRLRKIRNALKHATLKVRGDHARLRYRGYKLELQREENGRWRIADFD
ncbi:MAG: hypothetical protein KAI47_04870 [Deltaproteobacteria bacterium]|nr:hypothetical protein [Deltaproteobacteria bacterium]